MKPSYERLEQIIRHLLIQKGIMEDGARRNFDTRDAHFRALVRDYFWLVNDTGIAGGEEIGKRAKMLASMYRNGSFDK